ncbi:MAG: hypothetical protein HY716_06885 [Planctomycetes bacterium]|nr:hypothetical protein [Planctomycetota bacterium]
MKCLACGFKNPGTVAYCQRCGQKLSLSADEIRESMLQRAAGERRAVAETNARQAFFFAVLIFLVAVTLFFLAGSAPEGGRYVPSASAGSKAVNVKYEIEPDMKKMLVPFTKSRKP